MDFFLDFNMFLCYLLFVVEKEKRKVDKEYGLCNSPNSDVGNYFSVYITNLIKLKYFSLK